MNRQSEPAAEWLEVGDLTPWADNPRVNDHAVGQVAKSIERFGFAAPIVARRDGDGLEVVAGHTRLKAARQLGLDRVPVRVLDLDPADARLLALADNRLGEIADWSDDLGDLMQRLDDEGLDLEGLGWSDEELAALLAPEAIEADGTEDDVPEVQEEVHSQLGEVYGLGPHRLMCGDCRASTDVSTLLDGVVVNVAFTSPPYASQRKYDESSGFEPIKPDAYGEWFEAVQANVREHLAEDGSWFVNIKEHCEDGQRSLYVKDLTIAHVREWGWMFVDEFCWVRSGVPGRWPNRFKNGWEPVFHFTRTAGIKFDPTKVGHASDDCIDYSPDNTKTHSGFLSAVGGDNGRQSGVALPNNALKISTARADVERGHTAEFPAGLPAFFVKAYSDEGDTIFDPFMGSGTTLIAAAQERRVAYGIEISPGYCDVIRRRWTRWAQEHGQDPGQGAIEEGDK